MMVVQVVPRGLVVAPVALVVPGVMIMGPDPVAIKVVEIRGAVATVVVNMALTGLNCLRGYSTGWMRSLK